MFVYTIQYILSNLSCKTKSACGVEHVRLLTYVVLLRNDPFLRSTTFVHLIIHLFRIRCKKFRARSCKVRSPGNVKWPHLIKSWHQAVAITIAITCQLRGTWCHICEHYSYIFLQIAGIIRFSCAFFVHLSCISILGTQNPTIQNLNPTWKVTFGLYTVTSQGPAKKVLTLPGIYHLGWHVTPMVDVIGAPWCIYTYFEGNAVSIEGSPSPQRRCQVIVNMTSK